MAPMCNHSSSEYVTSCIHRTLIVKQVNYALRTMQWIHWIAELFRCIGERKIGTANFWCNLQRHIVDIAQLNLQNSKNIVHGKMVELIWFLRNVVRSLRYENTHSETGHAKQFMLSSDHSMKVNKVFRTLRLSFDVSSISCFLGIHAQLVLNIEKREHCCDFIVIFIPSFLKRFRFIAFLLEFD